MQPAYLEFQNPETGEYTTEFEKFWAELEKLNCKNFDCNQVAKAIKAGITPMQLYRQIESDYLSDLYQEDYEDKLNHDMSMNY